MIDVGVADQDQIGLGPDLLDRRQQSLVGRASQARVHEQRPGRSHQQVLGHEPRLDIRLDPVDSRCDLVDLHGR
jgi:hypothetical protein